MKQSVELWVQWNDTKYEVSTFGRVRDGITQKLLKSRPCGKGSCMYNRVVLYVPNINGETDRVDKYVSNMVAETFLPNPRGYDIVDHINNNHLDDRVDNLRWCSTAENQNWRVDTYYQKKMTEQLYEVFDI